MSRRVNPIDPAPIMAIFFRTTASRFHYDHNRRRALAYRWVSFRIFARRGQRRSTCVNHVNENQRHDQCVESARFAHSDIPICPTKVGGKDVGFVFEGSASIMKQ
jgi:hypothetical protein